MIRSLVFSAALVGRTSGPRADSSGPGVRGVPHRARRRLRPGPARVGARPAAEPARSRCACVGAEHVEGLGTCVYCANHVSFVDVGGVARRPCPVSVRFVAQALAVPYPGVRHGAATHGQIPVDRSNRDAAMDAFARRPHPARMACRWSCSWRARAAATAACSLQEGRVRARHQPQVPCVPVYVAGAWPLLPRGGLVPRPGTVEVRIGAADPDRGAQL